MWRSLVSALHWGCKGRGFESRHPDHPKPYEIRGLGTRKPLDLRDFRAALANEITEKMIYGWIESLREEEKAQSTISGYLRRTQGFFSWLLEQGKIARHPMEAVKVPKVKRGKGVVFCTREERDLLLSRCTDPELRFVLHCGFFLGLRKGEIIEARASWFRTPGICEVSETDTFIPKDKEARMVHYGSTFAAFLKDYGKPKPFMFRPKVRHGKDIYRTDFKKRFTTFVESCDLPWVRSHTMRHTFATLHVQAGTPIPVVAEWLGDDIQTTYNHYVGFAPNASHVANLD